MSHAIVNLLTGGKVVSISISSNFGGVTITQGGSRTATLMAGYIGSCMFGCMYILLAINNETCNYIAAAIYLFSCTMCLFVLKTEKTGTDRCMTGLVLRLSVLILIGAFVGLWILQAADVWPEKFVLSWGLLVIGTGNMLFALFECVEDTFLR